MTLLTAGIFRYRTGCFACAEVKEEEEWEAFGSIDYMNKQTFASIVQASGNPFEMPWTTRRDPNKGSCL